MIRRLVGPLLLITALVGMPGTSGAQEVASTSASTCSEPFAPYAHDHTDGATAAQIPLAGDPVPFTSAGAVVELVERVPFDSIVFTITLDGVSRTFTTEPVPVGSHYPNRSPGPEDTAFGRLYIVHGDAGATYVVMENIGSGTFDVYGWRFDDPCGSTPAGAVGARPTYTG